MPCRILSLFVFLAAFLAAQNPPAAAAPPLTIKKVGNGVYAAINPEGERAGSNAGFIVGDDSVLVVDALVDEVSARELLAEVRKITPLPIRFVVNTHYHLDHTGGNAVFAKEGAVIVAHPNVHKWLRTENLKFFGADPTPEQKARVESLVLPQLSYAPGSNIVFFLGSRVVLARALPGHTGGDTAVWLPDADVVFLGDLLWNARFPNMIDASTEPWVKTLETALAAHPNATFIPGHGDVATPQDVRDFHDYLVDLRKAVADARAAGKTGDELVKAVQPQLAEKYKRLGSQRLLPLNIAQADAELGGTKKIPQPLSPQEIVPRTKN